MGRNNKDATSLYVVHKSMLDIWEKKSPLSFKYINLVKYFVSSFEVMSDAIMIVERFVAYVSSAELHFMKLSDLSFNSAELMMKQNPVEGKTFQSQFFHNLNFFRF
jgi:hypothetical protein